jgi:DNA-binding NtrC family response regulator
MRTEGGETILVVDDEKTVLRFLVRALQSKGYLVLSAEDAEQAHAVLAAHPAAIDLIVADVQLGGGAGAEIAARAAAAHPGIGVLFMSGSPAGAADGGAAEFLMKPFDAETLWPAVRRVLDGRRQG